MIFAWQPSRLLRVGLLLTPAIGMIWLQSTVYCLEEDVLPSIRPLPPTEDAVLVEPPEFANNVQFIDLSGLRSGIGFASAAAMEVQLLPDLPTWIVYNNRKASNENHFWGESLDHMIECNLLRYTSPGTGITVTTGIVHDLGNHMWYDIKPNHLGQDTVTEIHEQDVPEGSGEQPPAIITPLGSKPFYQGWMHHVFSLRNWLNYNLGFIRQETLTNIDVMVIWTEDAECERSGSSSGCFLSDYTLSTMEAYVEIMVIIDNGIFNANSNTGVDFTLVHKQRDVSGYTAPAVNTSCEALYDLTDGSNNLGYIHTLRNHYKADLVQMVYRGGRGCGWVPSFSSSRPERGYSTVGSSVMAVGYVSAHEFGHNMGCNHDRGTKGTCNDTCNNFYGYRSPASSWRTVMAYDCEIGQCDNNPGTSCSRIPYLSGDYTYNGESLGGTSNNCRATFIANRCTVAGYMC